MVGFLEHVHDRRKQLCALIYQLGEVDAVLGGYQKLVKFNNFHVYYSGIEFAQVCHRLNYLVFLHKPREREFVVTCYFVEHLQHQVDGELVTPQGHGVHYFRMLLRGVAGHFSFLVVFYETLEELDKLEDNELVQQIEIRVLAVVWVSFQNHFQEIADLDLKPLLTRVDEMANHVLQDLEVVAPLLVNQVLQDVLQRHVDRLLERYDDLN